MPEDKLSAFFAKMDFFELEEEDGGAGYCYEPKEGGFYLIATNEAGDSPAAQDRLIVACYSPEDIFAWKVEFENSDALYAFYQRIGEKGLIGELSLREKFANPDK